MERLYLDTNVLFPMTLMDLLLSMAEDFLHEILWTDYLLDEWERVIVRERRRSPDQAAALCRSPAGLSRRANRARGVRGACGVRSRSRR